MRAKALVFIVNVVAFACLAHPGRCDDLVRIDLNVDGQSYTRGYSSYLDAARALTSPGGLRGIAPGYTNASNVFGSANITGVGTTEVYEGNSLTFAAPACGVRRTFSGTSREQSSASFAAYFEQNRDNIATCLAKNSPLFSGPLNQGGRNTANDLNSLISGSNSGARLDARLSSFNVGGYRTNDLSLPLGYAWRLSARDALELDVPVSVSDTAGGKSYSAGVGLLWRRRITTNWILQPGVHVGGVGSIDLATAAAYWSAGLSSVAIFDLPSQWRLTLANGLSYFSTIPLSIGRYNFDYQISNIVFRNGLLASRDLGFRILGLPTTGSLFGFDTRYAGTAVNVKNYQEIGGFLSAGSLAPVKLGVTYLTGARSLQGFTVNTGVRF